MKHCTLRAILLTLLSPLCASAHASNASEQSSTVATKTLPAAVRAYQLEYLAGMYESYATLTSQGKLDDPNAMTRLFIDHQRRIPSADLPANCQAYLADLQPIFTAVYDLLTAGKYEEANNTLLQLTAEAKAKHPEAAKLLGDDSETRAIISKIEREAESAAEEKMKAAQNETEKVKIVVDLFTEMAARARAAK